MNLFSFLFIVIIILFKICNLNDKKYILLPFSLIKEKTYSSQLYDSTIFIQNNFYKNITFDFFIGNPPQKVNGIIINDNLCFELKIEKDLYSYNNFFNYLNNKYNPKDSSTFSVINKEKRWSKGQYMTLGSDFFKFGNSDEIYNLTYLLNITEEELIDINEIKNQNYLVKFGLNPLTGFSGDECPNFFLSIKNAAKLNKFLASYIFIGDNNGYLVLGDELYNYNPKIYHESQHNSAYISYYYVVNHNKEIIIDNKNNKNITLNFSYAYLQYDLGVIIGTSQYRQIIDDIFFNKLINEKICQIDIVQLNTTDNYYIYSCNQKNLDLTFFPKIIFYSTSYVFQFELNYKDLFVKKYDDKYYFLVLFKVNNETNNSTNIKESWKLGQPFYKKYNFTMNPEARMLGFYNPNYNYKEGKEIVDNDTNNEKYNYPSKENSNNKDYKTIIIFSILCFIFIILLMIISFYFGMKLKEGRRKRANELKEDNYEYFPESTETHNNKLIN